MNLKLKKHLRLFLRGFLPVLLFFCFTISARAEGTAALSLQGTLDYAKAFDALNSTNQLRAKAGRSALKMDQELLETAMQRAAELALYFSHTRPDGTMCFTASDRMYGENVAYGYATVSSVMNGWRNSSGHYANIIDPNYVSIGIGCFCQGDTYYWVQCFGIEPAVSVSRPANCTKTMTINTDENMASQCLIVGVPTNRTLEKNKTGKITLMFQNYTSQITEKTVLSLKGFTLTSKNPDILSVSSNGTIKGLKAGTATLNLTCNTSSRLSATFQIKVTDASSRTVKLNANGGSFSKTSSAGTKTITVTYGKKYGSLPAAYRKGYILKGWYTRKSGGTKVTSSSKVTIARGKTQNLYAQWTRVTVKKLSAPKAKKQSSDKITVSWKKLSGVKGYEILCSTSKKFTSNTTQKLQISSSRSSAAFSGLKKGTTYYFKIRAYKTDSLGKKVYGAYSTVVSLRR